MGRAGSVAEKDSKNRPLLVGALMLSTLMETLDTTIANVALPHIQGSVSAGHEQITWVLTSYIVATAVMIPLSGWLSQRIGAKRLLLASIGAFTVTSMLCGMASTLPEIVIYRLLQGVAGASLIPVTQALFLRIYPPHLRPRMMSLWSAVMLIGPVLGPTIGGWFVDHMSWRWIFYVNAPLGALSFLVVYAVMEPDEGGRQRPFDALGYGAIVMFVLGLQIMLDRGTGQDWFYSREIWIAAIVAAVGLWVFLAQTATAEHPFFHRDLARDANFVGSTAIVFAVGVMLFSVSALLPSFMQNMLGYSALQSGVASIPRGFGTLLAFVASPALVRFLGPRMAVLCGMSIAVWTTWAMSRYDLSMDVWPIMITGFAHGLGAGLILGPVFAVLSFTTLAPRHHPEGAVVINMAWSLGASVGIAIVQAVLVRDAALAHARITERLAVGDPMVAAQLPAFMDPTTIAGLEHLNEEVTRQGTMIGYVNIFSWLCIGVLLLMPLTLLLKPASRNAGRHDPHI